MSRPASFKIFFIILFFINSVFADKTDFDFGMWLFEKEEYFRAISEFQRFIFFYPNDLNVPKAKFMIGLSFFKAERFADAVEAFENAKVDKNFSFIAGIYKADSLFLAGNYAKSREEYLRLKKENQSYNPHLNFHMFWPDLMEKKFDNVIKIISEFSNSDSPLNNEDLNILKERIFKLKKFKPLSPFLAGTLSLIPGLGQFYVKRPGDGVVAFFSVSSLTVFSYLLWKYDPHKELAISLSLLDLFLYAGNIYSAWSEAIRFNYLYYKQNLDSIKQDFWRDFPYR